MAQAQTKPTKVKSRERLHQLADKLPQKNLSVAQRLLEELKSGSDPVLQGILNAPLDDEPVTKQEEAAIAEGLADYKAGRVVSHEEVRRRFARRP